MAKFRVTLEETTQIILRVEADNEDAAIEAAREAITEDDFTPEFEDVVALDAVHAFQLAE